MKIITNQTFDEERALYGAENLIVKNCAFDGLADGESAFKGDVLLTDRLTGRVQSRNRQIYRWRNAFLICGIRSGMIPD